LPQSYSDIDELCIERKIRIKCRAQAQHHPSGITKPLTTCFWTVQRTLKLSRVLCVQAASEDYVKQTTASKDTRHPGQQQQYRPVQLDNIPLPTTGGHVTGNCNDFVCWAVAEYSKPSLIRSQLIQTSDYPDRNIKNSVHSWVHTLKDTWDERTKEVKVRRFQTVLWAPEEIETTQGNIQDMLLLYGGHLRFELLRVEGIAAVIFYVLQH
jgi:hypothetical protein